MGCRRCGGRPRLLVVGRRRLREINCLSASDIRIRIRGGIRTADIHPNTGDSGPADRRIHTSNEVCTGSCAISNDRALAGRRPVAVRDWDRPIWRRISPLCAVPPETRGGRFRGSSWNVGQPAETRRPDGPHCGAIAECARRWTQLSPVYTAESRFRRAYDRCGPMGFNSNYTREKTHCPGCFGRIGAAKRPRFAGVTEHRGESPAVNGGAESSPAGTGQNRDGTYACRPREPPRAPASTVDRRGERGRPE